MTFLRILLIPLLGFLCFWLVRKIMKSPTSDKIMDFSVRKENVDELAVEINQSKNKLKNRANELTREIKSKEKESKKAKELTNE